MTALIVAAAWVFGPWILFVAVIAACRWFDRRRQPIDALATAVTCPSCHPDPAGRCHCAMDCGHRFCRWAPLLTGLNKDEWDFLAGKGQMP